MENSIPLKRAKELKILMAAKLAKVDTTTTPLKRAIFHKTPIIQDRAAYYDPH